MMTSPAQLCKIVRNRKDIIMTLNPMGGQTYRFFELMAESKRLDRSNDICLLPIVVPYYPEAT